jgi:hypothetical protein
VGVLNGNLCEDAPKSWALIFGESRAIHGFVRDSGPMILDNVLL